jgi:uncharacterized Fe-S cluster-containing radical SAM superfamily protein
MVRSVGRILSLAVWQIDRLSVFVSSLAVVGYLGGHAGHLWSATTAIRQDLRSSVMYDPVEKAEEVATLVCQGLQRKYHRFRAARFYGGIATADCVGCSLTCVFCWSWEKVTNPGSCGQFYSLRQVANKLASIAQKKGFQQVRISGNEPTIGREHLLQVIELLPMNVVFILETNGILIGHDQSYAADLGRFPNVHDRVGLKGADEEEFTRLTGAKSDGFALQVAALENSVAAGVQCHPAVMPSFSSDANLYALRKRLAGISPRLADFEIETLALYGEVAQRLERARIEYRDAHEP